ncbi:probable cationic amino acid transporter [Sitodiplosis mosellana]|uniref:probable cationic amino acid transporter n=1 Tax=Sitodiplosis mosellana TaxID=263140 RepID=UPI00244429A8|nr:probable cationic amino acid transporter [Sitodiplosis mosellana]
MISDIIASGTYSRLAIGLIIFTHVIAYNESGAITVLFSAFIATICATFSAFCKSSLNHLQLPYIRATHKFDFFILFLAIWMDILTLICACGALTRTLSVCFDSMTGGMARIYILGRNAPENEPWPDVIGFSIIFIVSVMFMLGLENSKVFSYILMASLCGIAGILIAITSIRGNFTAWKSKQWLPKGVSGLVTSAALLVFTFPSEIPATGSCKRLKATIVNMFICLTIVLCAGCLSAVITFNAPEEFIAVPILLILETLDFHNFEPAIACLFVLVGSCAFLELFSEMFTLIVTLTTSDWKILSRQIGYEHGDSGSPVLAVFTGGSICAMISFACPLEIIVYFIAGSQLFSGLLRAAYLFYQPFRPKYLVNTKNDTSLGYSQLKPTATSLRQSVSNTSFLQSNTNVSTAGDVSRRILRCLSKPSIVSIPKPKSRTKKRNEEMEREWLLLGEPTSPRNTIILDDEQDTSTLTITPTGPENTSNQDGEALQSPTSNDLIESNSDTDSSTDIDAVVDEYRQKVEVTTSGPSEKVLRIPSMESWRLSIVLLVFYSFGVAICLVGFVIGSFIVFSAGALVVLFFTLVMLFLPRYSHSETSPNVVFCSMTILLESLLLGSTFSISLPAIIAWLIAGVLVFTRCDTWFSLCIEQPMYISHIVTPSVNGPSTSNLKSMIRLPRPPKGALIPSRIHAHGQCR